MTTARALQPEDEIAQYRVVGPLGAGGMGEVYLAQDRTLERNVALKVLPADLVKNEDRVRRFVQEAKSASSLNHPNIVTIYEIGQENVRSASGGDSGSVQYISMELISGKTLGAKIHEEKTDLRTLLGYFAQAAEGIAKAHAAGIVHRDLKPGNIMVSDDGFAKVLDFGLAKLTEKRGPENATSTAMTEVAERTSEGTVLGTVNYMSPEQVQGKSLDHRSDIFSFGCLLYEAATQRRPFAADSNVETMHKILHDKPAPIEELNPAAPAELRRLVRRCLAKVPDQRLQSMKDLAIELREIVDEYDALSASATSATSGSGATAALPARKSRMLPIVVGAVLVGAVGIGYGIWSSRRGGGSAVEPFQNMRATTQTNRGDVNFSALSPDGRYIAYIAGSAGRSTLRVRQVATGSDVEVLPVTDAGLESPSFSPDGNYLYFLKRSKAQPNYRSLVRVPSLGGPEEERAFDVDSRVTFSPDATQVCYMRGVPQEGRAALIIRDLDAGTEREFANVRQPEVIAGAPSWSPDGKRIAVFVILPPPKSTSKLLMFDVENGHRDDFFVKANAFFLDVAWIPDGRGLVLAGTSVSEGIRDQVFVITYPGGKLGRVTNDFSTYTGVSAAASGDGAIAALRSSEVANLYVASPADGTVRKLTNATSPEHSPFSFDVASDRVLFATVQERRLGIAAIPITGGEPQRLSAGPGHVTQLIARGNTAIFQRYDENGQQHIWRINIDGSGLKQVTAGGGEALLDVSRDGRQVAFAYGDSTRGVWVIPIEGGEVVPVAPAAVSAFALFSPDGKQVVVFKLEPGASGLIETVFIFFASSGGPELGRFTQKPNAIDDEWEPNGLSWTYLDRDDPARNVFRQQVGKEQATQITRFANGRLTDHAWSPDARWIAVVRRGDEGENVWVVDASGGSPKQVTKFDGEEIFQIKWSSDSQGVVVRAGNLSRDVVLISNFQ